MNSLSITDVTLQASDSSNSPTNGFNNNDNDNNNVNNPTIKADDLNLRNMVEKQRTTSSSPSPMTTLRSPSPLNIDSISGVIQPNRSRTESGTSHSGAGGNPGGSADTRRRITKLSKARERAKVPRLVEYFCVVSSVPIHNINGGDNDDADNSNNDNNIIPQQPPPPLSPSRPKINKVTPLPQTPNPSQHNNTNSNEGGNSSSNTNSSTTTTTASNNKNTSSSALNGSEFTPKITARYPLTDHEENPLLNDSITAFCYPSGTIPIHKVR